MLKDALAVWHALEGQVRKTVKDMSGKNLQCERYDVTTAPNPSTGKIGVSQPFGNEIFVPYSRAVAGAAVGDSVMVFWWKSLSNAKAWYMGDAIGEGGGNSGIAVQDDPPTGGELVWVDTDEDGNFHTIPEINDENTSSTDTWSSLKISQEISAGQDHEQYSMSNSYGTVTFIRYRSGLVVATLYSSETPAARTDIFTDIPFRFRPEANVYITGVDNSNVSRSMSFQNNNNGIVRGYAGSNKGAYVTVAYTSIAGPAATYLLAPYYEEPAMSAANEINALTDEWTSFPVITDTHTKYNSGNSQAIVRYLLDHSSAEKCFWLGDVPGQMWDENEYQAFRQQLLPAKSRIYFALGNHDRASWTSYSFSTVESAWNEFVGNHGLDAQKKFYYSIDDQEHKLRYVVINTSENATPQNSMTQTQINWIASQAQLPSSEWTLLVLGHVDIDYQHLLENAPAYASSETHSDSIAHEAQAICEAIGSCNGHIAGYICGHEHFDRVTEVSTSGKSFHQVVLLCDRIENTKYYAGISYPETRTAGTESEQAVTVVSINTTTKQVVLRRIGAVSPGMTTEFSYS